MTTMTQPVRVEPPPCTEPQSARTGGLLSYTARAWRGKLPLWETFWGLGFAVPVCFLLGYIFTVRVLLAEVPIAITVVSIAVLPILLAYTPFIYVATWRAANRYKGLQLWAWLAKAHVVICVINMLFGTPPSTVSTVVANLSTLAGMF